MVTPTLSVVVVTWNALGLLKRCLAHLAEAVGNLEVESVIVDNGSVDGTSEWLSGSEIRALSCPALKILRNQRNLGVARARNQGIQASVGRYVCLLDVDTEPGHRSLERLAQELDRSPDVALVGPRLVRPDGTLQYSCRRFPALADKLARRVPARFAPALARFARDNELQSWDHATPRDVDYVIGACQMVRKDALEQVGLLDERIFYGPEDVDICLRLWKGSWRVVYWPEAVVVHHERRLTRRLLSRLTLSHVIGLAYYFVKHGYLFRAPVGATDYEMSAVEEKSSASKQEAVL